MTLDEVAAVVDGVPNMSRLQGARVYDHIRSTGASDILEIGTAHGASACDMAAAVQGSGRVTTVDHAQAILSRDPHPTEMFARAGLSDTIDLILVEDSSYTWWLKGQIEQNSDDQGNCVPIYDFCYLDGAHNWTIDGLAVFLIEKLLRPGAGYCSTTFAGRMRVAALGQRRTPRISGFRRPRRPNRICKQSLT